MAAGGTEQTQRAADRPLLAASLRLLATAMVTAMFALVKLLEARGVTLVELVFYRQLFALPVTSTWIMLTAGRGGFVMVRPAAHLARTVVGLSSIGLTFLTVTLLPLAEATVIGFTAPILAMILSAYLLRERTGIHRWLGALASFAGVIAMTAPSGGGVAALGIGVGLAGAVTTGLVAVIVRRLTLTETPSSIVFWFGLFSVPPLAMLALRYGSLDSLRLIIPIALIGILGGVAQILQTSALHWGSVSLVVTMDYSAIIWSTALGWLLWGTLPTGATWAGAALIVAGSLYVVQRGRDRRPVAASAPPKAAAPAD